MEYRNFLFKTLAIILILLLLTAGINFLVDPLQFYRQATFYYPSFSIEQRYQNPGLAKNYHYDTIIIGSSMTENFVPAYVDKELSGKTLKLSMSGASAREENLIVKLALDTDQVKSVIWGLDYASLKGAADRVRNEDVPFPYYLYDQNPYNDFPYLLSISTLENSTRNLVNFFQNFSPPNINLQYLNNWNFSSKFGRDILIKMWQEDQKKNKAGIKQYDKIDGSFGAMQLSFDQNIMPLIRENPKVNFIVYYPPYSILRYRSIFDEDPKLFNNELQIKKYIFNEVKNCSNVIIYDFQSDPGLNANLDMYKDFSHHSQEFNEYIIDAISCQDRRYRVVSGNLETMLNALKKQVETLNNPQQNHKIPTR